MDKRAKKCSIVQARDYDEQDRLNGSIIRNERGTYKEMQDSCSDKGVDYYGASDVWIYDKKDVVRISNRAEIGQMYAIIYSTYLTCDDIIKVANLIKKERRKETK